MPENKDLNYCFFCNGDKIKMGWTKDSLRFILTMTLCVTCRKKIEDKLNPANYQDKEPECGTVEAVERLPYREPGEDD